MKYRLLRDDLVRKNCISFDTADIDEGNVIFFGTECIYSLEFIKDVIPRATELGYIEEVPEEKLAAGWTDKLAAELILFSGVPGESIEERVQRFKHTRGLR